MFGPITEPRELSLNRVVQRNHRLSPGASADPQSSWPIGRRKRARPARLEVKRVDLESRRRYGSANRMNFQLLDFAKELQSPV
jgi:hypothetical protein